MFTNVKSVRSVEWTYIRFIVREWVKVLVHCFSLLPGQFILDASLMLRHQLLALQSSLVFQWFIRLLKPLRSHDIPPDDLTAGVMQHHCGPNQHVVSSPSQIFAGLFINWFINWL